MRVGLFALGILVAVASAAAPAFAARDAIDVDDPWSGAQFQITHTARLIIDVEDPWGGAIVAHPPSARLSVDTIDPFARARANATSLPPAYHPRPAAPSARASDDALRAAIKAAIDAGELDRARALIDLLQKR